jgi:hypothetical protein
MKSFFNKNKKEPHSATLGIVRSGLQQDNHYTKRLTLIFCISSPAKKTFPKKEFSSLCPNNTLDR